MLHPDLILTGAKIYTGDPSLPWSTALAVHNGAIVALGDDNQMLALASTKTRRIHAGGRLVIPGLCDAHIHLYNWTLAQTQVQLATCRSKAEMLARIASAATQGTTESWLLGQGWNESWWGDTEFPTAADLDAVTGPQRPAIFWRSDMHIAVANHAALRRAGIDRNTEAPAGGIIDRDPTGAPTGVLRELAVGLVSRCIPSPTQADLAQALPGAIATLHRQGIVAVHDQRMKDGTDGPLMLAAYGRLHAEHRLPLRVTCNIAAHQLPELAALGLRSGLGDDFLQLGHVKVFADGSYGSRTAWMLEPYAKQTPSDPDNVGITLTPPEQMAAEFAAAQRLGFPISVHAIGDRANRAVLDLFQELAHTAHSLPAPHRIEHVQTLHPDDHARLAALDITASVQPIHLVDDRELALRMLGDRNLHAYPFQSLLGHGTRLAFGSDGPVADANPFVGIHAALARRRPGDADAWNPVECLALPEILAAYTVGPAQAVGRQARLGTLTAGKRADLLILDRDLFVLAQDPAQVDAIAAARPLLTLVDGQIVYQDTGFAA